MKNFIRILVLAAILCSAPVFADSPPGGKCISDISCSFGHECKDGVCIKKPEFDSGSKKSGKECQIDADCIGAGHCASGKFGKKYCTGN